MPPSKSNNDHLDQFLREIETTSEQVQKLLSDVRDSEVDFSAIKTELRILCENVKDISGIIRGGADGVSLLTRMALLEQSMKNLEDDFEKLQDNQKSQFLQKQIEQNKPKEALDHTEVALTESNNKWQMRTTMALAIVSLIGTILTTVLSTFGK